MKSHERYALLIEQYPGGVPKDVKAAFVAECEAIQLERAAALPKKSGGHEGKILYFGSLIASALSGFWILAGILVLLGLLYPVCWAIDRFPKLFIVVLSALMFLLAWGVGSLVGGLT